MQVFTVYTDGSFNSGQETHGGIVYMGGFNKVASRIHVYTTIRDFCDMRNVGGEIIAAYAAIQSIVSRVKKQNQECMDSYTLQLVYDYEGVGKWLTGGWKAKKKATQWFVREVRNMLAEVPNLKVQYVWVRGHGSTAGNNEADRVAFYDMDYCKANDIPIALLDEIIKL